MNPTLNKLLALLSSPHSMEYIIVDEAWKIIETSAGVRRFANSPEEIVLGKDVRHCFPLLQRYENMLVEIIQGAQDSGELKGIEYTQPPARSYIDINILGYRQDNPRTTNLIITLEDATERIVLEQRLVQKFNEAKSLSHAIAVAKKYIDQIIKAMADALIVTTITGKITRVNQATIDLFGYSEAELINQHISLIIADDNFLDQLNQLNYLSTGERLENVNVDVICKTKNGAEIYVEFSCSAIIDTEIEYLQQFVYVGRDMTDRISAEQEIRESLARERQLNELKSRLVSMVSHEFGNPLNRILICADLLENYSEDITESEKNQYIQYIRSAAKQMTNLLKDILIFSQGEVGKIKFQPAPLDLIKFCRKLIEEIKLSLGINSTINFVYSGIPKEVESSEYLILMDKKLLRHILTNLLSNAIKYSPESTVVNFQLFYHNEEIVFQIQDQGIGIPPEDIEKLFGTFHRAKNVGEIPGTGLGLTIVKQSVENHGGKIDVVSELGLGTTFTVTIPLPKSG